MLSKKSKTFIENLRMYLMTSGKNMAEVEELIDELRVHLREAEKAGRNIDQIIGMTPEQYMQSLEKEMKTDYAMILKLAPLLLIGFTAFIFIGSAIRNEFKLNIIQLVGFPIAILISLIIHIIFLRQAGIRQYSIKRFFVIGMAASTVTILIFLLLLLGSALFVEPFFVASSAENLIIIVICIMTFIILSLWSKSWTPIWIPAILSIPDILLRYNILPLEKIMYVQVAVFVLLFIIIIVSLYFTEMQTNKRKIKKRK